MYPDKIIRRKDLLDSLECLERHDPGFGGYDLKVIPLPFNAKDIVKSYLMKFEPAFHKKIFTLLNLCSLFPG